MALSVMTLACAVPGLAPAPDEGAIAAATAVSSPTVTEVVEEATPLPEPTVEPPGPSSVPPSPTVGSGAVMLRATGNVFIRRGPGLGYNALSYLQPGQTTGAHGRNATSDWLYVERPDTPGAFGWVALGTYTTVEGDPLTLEVVTADPAAPAYLRNCTFHPMRILPGDFILAEQFNAPNNMRQVNPGTYEAYDQNQEGNPMVLNPTIREGQTIDITTDGLNNTYSCPG
jgi:hypothetical protein